MLKIGSFKFGSRLILGTGKYNSLAETEKALSTSGTELVTVAIRKIDFSEKNSKNLLHIISPKKYTILPNTAGCYTAKEALYTLELAREILDGHNLVKLEILADTSTLYPNVVETIKCAELLYSKGFEVMAYTSDDPIVAKNLSQSGCVAIMPLGSLIGSGKGILNPLNISLIVEQASLPIIIDAGIGLTSDATFAMEMGCEAVLINSAIALSPNPIKMALAMKNAVIAGRLFYEAKKMKISNKSYMANATSPKKNF